MKWTLSQQVSLSIAATGVILGFSAWQFQETLTELLGAIDQQSRSYEVILLLRDLRGEMLNAQRGQRGFLITADTEYLEPYYTSINGIDRTLRELNLKVAGNQAHRRLLAELRPQIDDMLMEFARTIELRRRQGFKPAAALVKTGQGKQLMDRITTRLTRMVEDETRQRQRWGERWRQKSRHMTAWSISELLLIVGILTAMGLVIHQEIRRRSRAEKEAQTASILKSQFLANMSHEIRTPLNGILGMTEITLHTALSDEQRRYLAMVHTSGQALLSIINDILDFSKIEAGRMELDPIHFHLRESLAENLQLLNQKARRKQIELLYKVDEEVPNFLYGDVSRLKQILNNLVGNAIKFTERGEVFILVSLQHRSLNTATTGPASEEPANPSLTPLNSLNKRPGPGARVVLHFSVVDTGIGMNREQLARIFQPFVQADGSTTRRYGGTGLGLSITAHLIEALGGRIQVESEPGHGSTFHFTLPMESFAESPTPILPAELTQLTGKRVLIIDDNNTNRTVLYELVRLWKMIPVMADSGAQGLSLLGEAAAGGRPFDLVLLDFGMPDMDGFEVARRIQADPALAAVKVILQTSSGQIGDGLLSRQLGIDGYLTKPVGEHELLAVIRLVLSPDRPQSKSADGSQSPGQSVITLHTAKENRRTMKILLAEDNEINQVVCRLVLEKAGHKVVIAADGREAVEQYRAQPFDLILMDVHMPDMDGFEATGVIRTDELQSGRHIPIMALTANAIKGDREACLAAGMDTYLSKPFQTHELLQAIEAVESQQKYCLLPALQIEVPNPPEPMSSFPFDTSQHHQEVSVAESPALESPALDWETFRERMNGNDALIRKITTLYNDLYPRELATMAQATAQGDAKLLEESAHLLKGSLANFGQGGAYEAALQLELKGRAEDFEGVDGLLERLRQETLRLELSLRERLNNPW